MSSLDLDKESKSRILFYFYVFVILFFFVGGCTGAFQLRTLRGLVAASLIIVSQVMEQT